MIPNISRESGGGLKMIKYCLWNGSDCNNKKIVFKNNESFSWLKRNSNRTIPDEEIGLMETDFGTF